MSRFIAVAARPTSTFSVDSSRRERVGVEIGFVPSVGISRQHSGAVILEGPLNSDAAIDSAASKLKAEIDEAAAAAKALLRKA